MRCFTLAKGRIYTRRSDSPFVGSVAGVARFFSKNSFSLVVSTGHVRVEANVLGNLVSTTALHENTTDICEQSYLLSLLFSPSCPSRSSFTLPFYLSSWVPKNATTATDKTKPKPRMLLLFWVGDTLQRGQETVVFTLVIGFATPIVAHADAGSGTGGEGVGADDRQSSNSSSSSTSWRRLLVPYPALVGKVVCGETLRVCCLPVMFIYIPIVR